MSTDELFPLDHAIPLSHDSNTNACYRFVDAPFLITQKPRGRTSSLHSSSLHHGDSADRSPRGSSRISSPRPAEPDMSPTESALARAEIYSDSSSSPASDRTLPSPRPSVGVGCSSGTSNGSSSCPRLAALDASRTESALGRAEIYSDSSSSLASDRTLPSPRPSIGVGCSSDTSGSNSTPSPRTRTPNVLSVACRTRASSPREVYCASREPSRGGLLRGSRQRAPGRPSRFSSSEDTADSCEKESTTPGQVNAYSNDLSQ